MSLEHDITEIKRMAEAGGLFKPATPEQVANRKDAAKPYTSLNDVYSAGDTEIWYWKDSPQRVYYAMGYKYCAQRGCLPDPEDLERTHVLLGKVALTSLGIIYDVMQGEDWSPNGEARDLIKSKGLDHTSLS